MISNGQDAFSRRFCIFAIYWGVFSSVVSLILIKAGVGSQMVFSIKDLPIYGGALIFSRYWLGRRGSVQGAAQVIALTTLFFLNFIILNSDYKSPLNNIRQLIGPLALLLIFSSLRLGKESAQDVQRHLVYALLLTFGFGIFEQVVELWTRIDLTEFFYMKGIPVDDAGVSFMFYEPLLGGRERMTSFFIDPISLGHFFASAALLLIYGRTRGSKFELIGLLFSVVGLVLTFSKGAMLQLFIGAIILSPRIPVVVKAVLTILVVVFVVSLPDKDGILIHVEGFLNSIGSMTPFGYGIGSVGNYASMFGANATLFNRLLIRDTFVGALFGQVGLLGALLWFYVIFSIPISNSSSFRAAIGGVRILSSILIVSILSENTMNVTSFMIPSVLIGLEIAKARNKA